MVYGYLGVDLVMFWCNGGAVCGLWRAALGSWRGCLRCCSTVFVGVKEL